MFSSAGSSICLKFPRFVRHAQAVSHTSILRFAQSVINQPGAFGSARNSSTHSTYQFPRFESHGSCKSKIQQESQPSEGRRGIEHVG